MRNACSVLLLACVLATVTLTAALAEPWSWGKGPKPAYIEICDNNKKPDRDRDRICSAYIQAAFAEGALPEQALFLRERLNELIGNYDEAAKSAFDWYHRLVMASLLIAAISAGWTWWRGVNAERLLVLSAISAVIIATLSAFGYNTQFKAHFAAARNLTVVKDNIEIELISAAKSKNPIGAELIANSMKDYKSIVEKHVEAFGGSFTPPSTLLIN